MLFCSPHISAAQFICVYIKFTRCFQFKNVRVNVKKTRIFNIFSCLLKISKPYKHDNILHDHEWKWNKKKSCKIFPTSFTSAICAEIFFHLSWSAMELKPLSFSAVWIWHVERKKSNIIKLTDRRSRPHASYLKAIFHLTPSSYQLFANIYILCKLFNLHFHVFSLVL